MLRIGCHLSSSKGYLNMGRTAVDIGANTFQFFTRNPRGGAAKPLDVEDMQKYCTFAEEHGIAHILAHAPYTLNACAADEGLRTFARETMEDDLKRLEHVPGSCYNFHPGSHVKQGVEVGIRYITEMLNAILKPDQSTTVLLETMAGKGSEVGRTFEEIRIILDGVELQEKMGVCLDTCHVYDGGYDIVNQLDDVLEEFDRVIGLDHLKAIHLNDSKNPLGSHKDRHEKIGEGSIGLEAVTAIINHPSLKHSPFYLETPNELPGYQKEIELLKSLYQESTMEIRKGTLEDLPAILQIYEEARAFMKEQGNRDQWGDRWPPEELIRNDIRTGLSHVCVDRGEVVACFVYFVGEEPDYRVIVEGAWPNERPYSVVHRIATKRGTHGVAKFCLGWAYEQHVPLRMDTHKNNLPMQNLLRKCGFRPCGVIRIHEDGSLRDAFIRL